MKLFNFIAAMIAATILFSNCSAQTIAHSQTETVKIYGNCGMCKKTIEKAALKTGIAIADWDSKTQIAKITFDTTKTNLDEILKNIAAVGYDSEKFRAPEEVYNNLHGCCQYDRPIIGQN